MLLTIDIGNTNVVWGLFEDSTLRGHWRLATESRRTDDEYGILLLNLLDNAGFSPEQITGCILSSVVPALTATFDGLTRDAAFVAGVFSPLLRSRQVAIFRAVLLF